MNGPLEYHGLVWFCLMVGTAAFVIRSDVLRETWYRDRPDWSMDEIYASFADPHLNPDDVRELWLELAGLLGIAPGQLRPQDCFGRELGWSMYAYGDEIDDVYLAGRRRGKERGVEFQANVVRPVADYVLLFARRKDEVE